MMYTHQNMHDKNFQQQRSASNGKLQHGTLDKSKMIMKMKAKMKRKRKRNHENHLHDSSNGEHSKTDLVDAMATHRSSSWPWASSVLPSHACS